MADRPTVPDRCGHPSRAPRDADYGRGLGRDRLLREVGPPADRREVSVLPRRGQGEGRTPVDGPRLAPERGRWGARRRPERARRESADPGGTLRRRAEDAAEAEAVRGPG